MDKEKQPETPQSFPSGDTPAPTVETQAVVADAPSTETEMSEAAAHPQVTLDEEVAKLLEEEVGEFAGTAAANDESARLQEEVAAMTMALSATQAQFDDVKSQYARLAADFDNFRKRTKKEKEELTEQIQCTTIKELLPVVDNFERARAQIKPQTDAEMNIHKSYQGVYKQLVDGLKRLGVSPMRPEGQEFDPNLHEAVAAEPAAGAADNHITDVYQNYYRLKGRLLRPAMVKVARNG